MSEILFFNEAGNTINKCLGNLPKGFVVGFGILELIALNDKEDVIHIVNNFDLGLVWLPA